MCVLIVCLRFGAPAQPLRILKMLLIVDQIGHTTCPTVLPSRALTGRTGTQCVGYHQRVLSGSATLVGQHCVAIAWLQQFLRSSGARHLQRIREVKLLQSRRSVTLLIRPGNAYPVIFITLSYALRTRLERDPQRRYPTQIHNGMIPEPQGFELHHGVSREPQRLQNPPRRGS